ncbi:MAG: VCBS repeat-containing protein, partial [Bacteroidetes bacterium]|nr:VCBS repeat-containing protein [Bacteroidota bacterium]
MRTLTLLVITMGWLSGSFASNADSLLFKLLNSSDCGIDFINTVDTTLDKYYPYNRASRLYYYGGGGVCAADFNNDGLSDLYFVSNVGDNKLYLNKGGLKFEDATTKANVAGSPYAWSRGVALADVNQDGHMDIYICNSEYGGMGQSKNELFINNGKGIFKEKAAEYGVDDAGNSFQASFFDYDRDNDLDLFLITHIQEKEGMKTFASNDRIKAGCQKDKLLRNDDGKFVDVTEFSGIENCASAVNVITTDLTGDGWPDIFLQNDFSVPDRIFVNQQDSTFKEQSQQYFGHYSFSSKGGDVGDVNNDGHLDLFTLDVYPEDLPTRKLISRLVVPAAMKWLSKENLYNQKQQNCLFLGNGNHYDEIAHFAGVHSTNYSWGGRLADLDNDGFQDIVISNAAVLNSILVNYGTGSTTPASMFDRKIMPSALSNYVFKNNGDLTFSNKVDQWGLSKAVNSNGLVVEDLDNDGDLDLVFNNLNSLSAVYENRSEKLKNNFVKIRLLKNKKVSDLGATAWVYHGGEVQIAQTL